MNDQLETYQAHKQTGLLLNANEASENLPEELIGELQQMLPDLLFNRYPEDSSTNLRSQYAEHLGIPADMVIAGNGSDQMLQLLITSFVSKGDTLYTLAPDFSMYDFYVSAMKGKVKRYPLLISDENGFSINFDIEDFIAQAKEANPSLVMFSNPNNPTGMMITPEKVERIAAALYPVPVVMDEAYMDFGGRSAVELLLKPGLENLYITRTLSKAYALAGLRVGFLISKPENIRAIDPARPVYNLNSFSSAAACKVLEHADHFEERTRKILQERIRMQKAIKEMKKLCSLEANGNFILVYPNDPARNNRLKTIEKLVDLFMKNGITIRDYANKDYLRITVGLKQENDQVLELMKSFDQSMEGIV